MTDPASPPPSPEPALLLDGIPDLVQVMAADGRFLYVNPAWCQRMGWSADEARAMGFIDVLHPDHQGPWRALFKSVLGGRRLDHFEVLLLRRDGRALPVDGSIWPHVSPGAGPTVVAVLHDATARASGEREVAKLLYRDAETGLFNRRGFVSRAMRLIEVVEDNPERLGAHLLYLELANADAIQRRHGDAALADAVQRTAALLRQALRAHDVVARMDRTGFAALVTLPTRYPPNYLLARIRGALTLANRHAAKGYDVELALGLADVATGQPLDEAVARAAAAAALTSPNRERKPLV